MSLAEIIRAQLATGRPLRVTRALLEALNMAEAGCRVTDSYTVDLGRDRDEALRNARAWADERDVMRRERDEARQSLCERTAEREALCERVSQLEESLRLICEEARKAGEHG